MKIRSIFKTYFFKTKCKDRKQRKNRKHPSMIYKIYNRINRKFLMRRFQECYKKFEELSGLPTIWLVEKLPIRIAYLDTTNCSSRFTDTEITSRKEIGIIWDKIFPQQWIFLWQLNLFNKCAGNTKNQLFLLTLRTASLNRIFSASSVPMVVARFIVVIGTISGPFAKIWLGKGTTLKTIIIRNNNHPSVKWPQVLHVTEE